MLKLENKTLHIVSFNVPFPANYGGAIDIFYKIKSLNKAGVNIILHCYHYGRKEAVELKKYCQEVHYYKRNMNPLLLLNSKPFIVATRNSDKLMQQLEKDKHPILLEGVHSCAVFESNKLIGRKIIVRNHNIEHEYYKQLALVEKNLFKKWFFTMESKKLLNYEKQVFPLANEILGISKKDTEYIKNSYKKGIHVSAYHQFDELSISESMGDFAFYHGNLAVSENNLAAIYLVQEVFSKTKYPLIIAGNSPSKELIELCNSHGNVTLKADIESEEIMSLITAAQMNVLPTFQNTGIKLKLLAALFRGKYCLVNSPMVKGTGLENLCIVNDSAEQFARSVEQVAQMKFTRNEIEQRKKVLSEFKNKHGTAKCLAII